jgi:hypothetical protein
VRQRTPRFNTLATCLTLGLALAFGLALAACSSEFPATSACPEEPRAAGTLPDLELVVPSQLSGQATTVVDSGWNCLSTTLGSYAAHGVTRLEFAGATWDAGNGDGSVAAVFRTGTTDPQLQASWVEEFYEQGARASRGVENVETSRLTMDGAGDVWRLDALNNLSLQTIVAWPHGDHVHVVLVASTVEPGASRDAHEAHVDETVLAAASVDADGPASRPPSSASPGTSALASVLLSPA